MGGWNRNDHFGLLRKMLSCVPFPYYDDVFHKWEKFEIYCMLQMCHFYRMYSISLSDIAVESHLESPDKNHFQTFRKYYRSRDRDENITCIHTAKIVILFTF